VAPDRLLVALDVESLADAEGLLARLDGVVTGCKIGTQLFTAAGPAAVEMARKRGFRVFLDLKFHDIPNTVAGATRETARLGVFMLDVHASGGVAMMRAAAEAATRAAQDFAVPRPLVLGVTVLTSLDRRALQQEVGVAVSVDAHVLHLADARARPGSTAAWRRRERSARCAWRWAPTGSSSRPGSGVLRGPTTRRASRRPGRRETPEPITSSWAARSPRRRIRPPPPVRS